MEPNAATQTQPDPGEPQVQAPTDVATEQANDDVYAEMFDQTIGEELRQEATPTVPTPNNNGTDNADTSDSPESLTRQDELVLAQAGMRPEDYASWDSARVQEVAAQWRDKLGIQPEEPVGHDEEPGDEPDPVQAADAAEVEEGEISPDDQQWYDDLELEYGSTLSDGMRRRDQEREARHNAEMDGMIQLVGGLYQQNALMMVRMENPAAMSDPSQSQAVQERYQIEWLAGGYANQADTPFQDRVLACMREAAKHVLNGTSEHAARTRYAANATQRQQRTPSNGTPSRTPTLTTPSGDAVVDPYASAFQGSELEQLSRQRY